MRMITIMEKLKNNNRILLGLSGGVDSTAAVLILKEKGYDVTGYYFDVTGDNEEGRQAAQSVADQLQIPLIIEDVSSAFHSNVINNFCREYACGRTPNPCIVCNPTVKFAKLAETADRIGAKYIGTGHYARVYEDKSTGIFYIMKGASEKKDQSYMLYRLPQEILSRLVLPLGDFESKDEIRKLVGDAAISNADAPDSQEICFIDEKLIKYEEYIEKEGYPSRKGNFVDMDGNVLGQHKGVASYTIGQRKGLGIALGKPAFVVKIDDETGDVVLGDNDDLFRREVYSVDNVFADSNIDLSEPVAVEAKIRYAAKPARGVIRAAGPDKVLTVFDQGQRAPAPGQSIVFYQGPLVIGGGFIR